MTKKIVVPIVILLAALVLFLTIEGNWPLWQGGLGDQKTDDATVRADVTPLSTRVTGTVRQVNVSDYAAVKKGQCLVELEDSDYRAALAQAQAALDGAKADLAANQDAKGIEEEKIAGAHDAINQAQSAVDAAKAGIAAVEGDLTRANQEITRQQSLLAARAATKQQVEGATADAARYAGLMNARKADAERAESALAQARSATQTEARQRAALNTRDLGYRAQIEARKAGVTVALVNLDYTKVCAPVDGTVGERHVQAGQLVAAGMHVIDLVSRNLWIQANFKEVQLRNIRPGDRADVTVDSLPGHVFRARVTEIAPASGSQFALIPPDNATGNYTKVVQRVPVKLVLDQGQTLSDRILPGLSAVVTIHTADQRGNG